MAENNLRQALVPVGAAIIPQTRGTAPGLDLSRSVDGAAKVIYAVPGVPHEMKDMVQRAVLPDLLARAGEASVIVSRTLRTWGESESGLNERLDPIIDRLETPAIRRWRSSPAAGRASRCASRPRRPPRPMLRRCSATWEAEVRSLIDDLVFGVDDETMESVVLQLLRERGWSLGPGRVGHRWTGRRADHQCARCQ